MYRERDDHDPYERDSYGRADPYADYDRPSRGYRAEGGTYGGGGRRGRDEERSRGYERGREFDRGRGYDDEGESWGARMRQKRKDMPLWQELPLLLIVAFCLAVLVRTFLVQAFFIPSGSMEPGLQVGDRVLVNKIVYDVRQPERGEIVVFRGTDNWAPENQVDTNIGFFAKLGRTVGDLVGFSQPGEKDFIKRVVGLPGDTVACCDVNGRVTVNGTPLDEPYVQENSPIDAPPSAGECKSRRFDPVTVEQGQMFVMGDHRLVSLDARCQGQVPIENVIGKAFCIVWPSRHWECPEVPATFSGVRKPQALIGPNERHTPIPLPGGEVPALVMTVPILASLPLTARSRRIRRSRRRTLPK
jgi:signal peptidase I